MAGEAGAKPRLGIIGCGAVTQIVYLPALKSIGVNPCLFVDTHLDRAREASRAWPEAAAETSWERGIGRIDVAIVALPHSLHAPVCSRLLSSGIHVLVEKPMAVSLAEGLEMTSSAEASGTVLAVGLLRRFLFAARWLRALLRSGLLGEIESFDVREGFVYSWPVTSGFFFRRESAGGGVLIDTGAHTLDLLLWWLGELAVREYLDDAWGGVEADCQLRLTTKAGASGFVELSRTRNLRNTILLRGSRGEVEVSLHKNVLRAKPRRLLAFASDGFSGRQPPQQTFLDLCAAEVLDFLSAAALRAQPAVPGTEAARSIALIEECYRRRRPLVLPWATVEDTGPDGRLP